MPPVTSDSFPVGSFPVPELPFLVFLHFCGTGVGEEREKVVDERGGWRYSDGLSQDGNPLHYCSRCTGIERWLEGHV